jgi:hypothetical protein
VQAVLLDLLTQRLRHRQRLEHQACAHQSAGGAEALALQRQAQAPEAAIQSRIRMHRLDRGPDDRGDVGHAQAIQVAQGDDHAVGRGQPLQALTHLRGCGLVSKRWLGRIRHLRERSCRLAPQASSSIPGE